MADHAGEQVQTLKMNDGQYGTQTLSLLLACACERSYTCAHAPRPLACLLVDPHVCVCVFVFVCELAMDLRVCLSMIVRLYELIAQSWVHSAAMSTSTLE